MRALSQFIYILLQFIYCLIIAVPTAFFIFIALHIFYSTKTFIKWITKQRISA